MSIKSIADYTKDRLSRAFQYFPLGWLGKAKVEGTPQSETVFKEKLKQVISSQGHHVRFLPYADRYTEETDEIRKAYPVMLRDPYIKQALYTKVFGVASLDLQMHSASKSSRDKEIAEFAKHCIQKCRGGSRRAIMSIAIPGAIFGYSVTEINLRKPTSRGQFGEKITIESLKSKDVNKVQLEGDEFGNISGVRDKITNQFYHASNFLIYSHMPLFETPTGISDFRAAYRAYWLADTAWQLRAIGLERYGLPVIKGTYRTDAEQFALEQSLPNLRSQGWITVPEGALVEAMDIAARGTTDFESAIRDLREEMVLAIAGAILQMLTTTGTAEMRGSADVQKGTFELLQWYLAQEAADVLNDQLFPQLIDLNYRGADYPTCTFGGVNDGAMKDSITVDQFFLQSNLPLSKEEMYEKYGRQQPLSEDDAVTSPQAQQPQMPFGGGGGFGGGQFAEDGIDPQATVADQAKQIMGIQQVYAAGKIPRSAAIANAQLIKPDLAPDAAAALFPLRQAMPDGSAKFDESFAEKWIAIGGKSGDDGKKTNGGRRVIINNTTGEIKGGAVPKAWRGKKVGAKETYKKPVREEPLNSEVGTNSKSGGGVSGKGKEISDYLDPAKYLTKESYISAESNRLIKDHDIDEETAVAQAKMWASDRWVPPVEKGKYEVGQTVSVDGQLGSYRGTFTHSDGKKYAVIAGGNTGQYSIPIEKVEHVEFKLPDVDTREHHQKTWGERRKELLQGFMSGGRTKATPIELREMKKEHHDKVMMALAAGKSVPPEVLADYPDLAANYAKPAAKPAKKPAKPATKSAPTPDAPVTDADRDHVLKSLEGSPVHDISDLRKKLAKQLPGAKFDKAILDLADNRKIQVSQDSDPNRWTAEQRKQFVVEGDKVYTNVMRMAETPDAVTEPVIAFDDEIDSDVAPSHASQSIYWPDVRQEHSWDCGPAEIVAAGRFCGIAMPPVDYVARECGSHETQDTAPGKLVRVMKAYGIDCQPKANMSFGTLRTHLAEGRPCVVHVTNWDGEDHYIAIIGNDGGMLEYHDPDGGYGQISEADFAQHWDGVDRFGVRYPRWGVAIIGRRGDGPDNAQQFDDGPRDSIIADAPHQDTDNAIRLSQASQQNGVEVVAKITEDAVTRLARLANPLQAASLFTMEERQALSDALASTLATADLLGRSRTHIRAEQVRRKAGGFKFSEPTSFQRFDDDPAPEAARVSALPPSRALEYFASLVPTITVAPTYAADVAGRAFTLAGVTETNILQRVKDVIQGRLETGQAFRAAPMDIQRVLDDAGVSVRNPQYSEQVFRTNMIESYNRGSMDSMRDPDVAEIFPAWQYHGIRDGRQRLQHQAHFGRYFPKDVDFDSVRDHFYDGEFSGYNCRCTLSPVSKYEWKRLQERGESISELGSYPMPLS